MSVLIAPFAEWFQEEVGSPPGQTRPATARPITTTSPNALQYQSSHPLMTTTHPAEPGKANFQCKQNRTAYSIHSASFAFLCSSTVVHRSYLTKRITICCLNHRSSVPATSSIAFLKLLSFGKSLSSCFLAKFHQLVLNSSPLYFLFIPYFALHSYLIRHHDQAVSHFLICSCGSKL